MPTTSSISRLRTAGENAVDGEVVIGIDVGGSTLHGVLMTSTGDVLASQSVPTRTGGTIVLRQIQNMVDHLGQSAPRGVTAVGVGATGIIEAGTGRVLVSTSAFADWVGHCLADELTAKLNLPVVVSNDVKAFLLGEMYWGAMRDVGDVLGVTIGTGVGGAIALNGRIVEGQFSGAGEIGHFPGYSEHICACGGVGHLETVASGPAIARRYAERTGAQQETGMGVARRARAGDGDAVLVLREAAGALADALLSAVSLLDISHVVMGGGVVGAWDLLVPLLRDRIASNPPISGNALLVRRSCVPYPAMGAASLVLQPSDRTGNVTGRLVDPTHTDRLGRHYSAMSGTKT